MKTGPEQRTARNHSMVLLAAVFAAAASFANANTGPLSVDFRQAANNETSGPVTGLGVVHWISPILQESNSRYQENMVVPQRVILTNIPWTNGDVHTLAFSHQSTKGGVHAYDFLTSYDHAYQTALAVGGFPLTLDPCGVDLGPPSDVAGACLALRGGPYFMDIAVPDDAFISKDGPTQGRLDAFESRFGNRTIRLYAELPITAASFVFLRHNVSPLGDIDDSYVEYLLTWTSHSHHALIEMGGHLALSGDASANPLGWGEALGAAQQDGGPYHFKLGDLGAAVVRGIQTKRISLGTQDHEIQLPVTPPCPLCTIVGATSVCPGGDQDYSATVIGTAIDPTYHWSLSGNAALCGPADGLTVCSTPDAACGAYNVALRIVAANCPFPGATCETAVEVTDTVTPTVTCSADRTFECSAVGDPGEPTATDDCDAFLALDCTDEIIPGAISQERTIVRTCTAGDDCGNSAPCTQRVEIVDTTPPSITCPTDRFFECGAIFEFGDPTVADNCSEHPQVSFLEDVVENDCTALVTAGVTPPPKLTVTRTYSAFDGGAATTADGSGGNTAFCVQRIDIFDTTAPSITCPSDRVFECDAVGDFGEPTVHDVCDDLPRIECFEEVIPGHAPQEKTIFRTCIATDDCGNQASCVQRIDVVDTTPPDLSCPSDLTFECDALGEFGDPQVTDNCNPAPNLGFFDETVEGECMSNTAGVTPPPKLTVLRTYIANDAAASTVAKPNTSTCVQRIDILDTTPPMLVDCPESASACEGEPIRFTPPTCIDACGDCLVECARSDGLPLDGPYPIGPTPIACRALDECGNAAPLCHSAVQVNPNPVCEIAGDDAVCKGESSTLCAPPGFATYSWSTGESTPCISASNAGEYCVTVADGNACTGDCCKTLLVVACAEEHCTLTQGAYGNDGGTFNELATLPLIQSLLADAPLIVGLIGVRSVTIPYGAAPCIIDRLPSGGRAVALPSRIGDTVLADPPVCQTPSPISLKNGRFNNILLGQTIALSLNVRLDSGLADLSLCDRFTTHVALRGPDRILGTADDLLDPGPDGVLGVNPATGINDDPIVTLSIAGSVLAALTALGEPQTVSGLLNLANRGLAGSDTGGASLADVNRAVEFINRGFDECRFRTACTATAGKSSQTSRR